jgi:hypothetical protein
MSARKRMKKLKSTVIEIPPTIDITKEHGVCVACHKMRERGQLSECRTCHHFCAWSAIAPV